PKLMPRTKTPYTSRRSANTSSTISSHIPRKLKRLPASSRKPLPKNWTKSQHLQDRKPRHLKMHSFCLEKHVPAFPARRRSKANFVSPPAWAEAIPAPASSGRSVEAAIAAVADATDAEEIVGVGVSIAVQEGDIASTAGILATAIPDMVTRVARS